MGECEEWSHQRGLSHCMEVTPRKTYWPPQWTASDSPVLPLREKDLHSFSQSHQSRCMSSSRFWFHWTLHWLNWHVLKLSLFSSRGLKWTFFSLFCGEIFPHHTVPIPQSWVSWTKEPSVSLTLPLELKNEKLSFHRMCPVQSFSEDHLPLCSLWWLPLKFCKMRFVVGAARCTDS